MTLLSGGNRLSARWWPSARATRRVPGGRAELRFRTRVVGRGIDIASASDDEAVDAVEQCGDCVAVVDGDDHGDAATAGDGLHVRDRDDVMEQLAAVVVTYQLDVRGDAD